MIYFIIFLRFLAAILITNSHYQNIYPLELMASGGLLGDVLFFSISGFLVGKTQRSFPNWYSKRIVRIYPSVIIITISFLVIGAYSLEALSLFEYLIFPTNYHFIASIMILYVPMYFISKYVKQVKYLHLIILFVVLSHILVYFLFYDYSYYHIDNVREPMIRFLFFLSMLIGYYFNLNAEQYLNNFKIRNLIFLLISLIFYFTTKLIFASFSQFSLFQILNQYSLLLLLFFLFKFFSSIEMYLKKVPPKIFDIVQFISKLTLEIYLVQYVVIPAFENIMFPLNFILVTISIFISAYLLFSVTKIVESKLIKILKLNG